MRVALVVACLALAGCDALLRLQHITPPVSGDGPEADSGDGSGCTISLDDTMDEDCDGVPDSSDPCPADIETRDSDSDGIGDACDPSGATQDGRLLFDGFATLDSTWSQLAGSWSASAGAIDNNNTDALILRDLAMPRVLIEAYVDVVSFGTNPYIVVGFDDAAGSVYDCAVFPTATGVEVEVTDAIAGGGTSASGPQTLVGAGRLRVQLVEDDVMKRLLCRVHYDGPEVVATLGITPFPSPGVRVRLQTSSVHVRFESVTVTGM